MKTRMLLTAAVVLIGAGCESDDNNVRDETVQTTSAPINNLSQADQTFISDAASSDRFEIQSSKLALQQQNADPGLRQLAQMMIDDHSQSMQELQRIASRNGLSVP